MATEVVWLGAAKIRIRDGVTPWTTTGYSIFPYVGAAVFDGLEDSYADVSTLDNSANVVGGTQTLTSKAFVAGVDTNHFSLTLDDNTFVAGASGITYGGFIVMETVSQLLVFRTINETGDTTVAAGGTIRVDWKPEPVTPGAGVPPADPAARQGAKDLLSFFYSQWDKADPNTKRVIAGHHMVSPWETLPLGRDGSGAGVVESGDGYAARQAAINQAQLDYFLVEAELWNGPNKVQAYDWMADQYDAGYIPMGCLHMQNPVNNAGWDDAAGSTIVDFEILTDPSTALHDNWMTNYVEKVAIQCKRIQDNRGTNFILRGPTIEPQAVRTWFSRFNPSLNPTGGDPSLHGLWFDQFIQALWDYGAHNFIVAYHCHQSDPLGWGVAQYTASNGLPARTFSTAGGAGAGTGGGSFYGDRVTGWEALAPTLYDIPSLSCYWQPGTMSGIVPTVIGMHECLRPDAPVLIGECGPGQPGAGNVLDYNATNGFRQELVDAYVASANARAQGNTSGLNPFVVAFSNWFQTWRIGGSATSNWIPFLQDPVLLGKGEGVARP